ncbi:hypothetical protein LCGC14_0846210 [marine sediment metagenome]|uniref:Uncharacterized protein n=1 Tax=marine sediment metagenome TaxID=412755 RepID=A0A0F9PGF3_9ZZZZ
MFNFTCQYDPAQHYIIEPEIIRWCRRQVDDKETKTHLFAYFHLRHRTFVIGWWVGSEHGRFVDMINLGYSLSNFDRSMAQEFVRRLKQPTTSADIHRFMNDSSSDELHRRQDDGLAEAEVLDRDFGLN